MCKLKVPSIFIQNRRQILEHAGFEISMLFQNGISQFTINNPRSPRFTIRNSQFTMHILYLTFRMSHFTFLDAGVFLCSITHMMLSLDLNTPDPIAISLKYYLEPLTLEQQVRKSPKLVSKFYSQIRSSFYFINGLMNSLMEY